MLAVSTKVLGEIGIGVCERRGRIVLCSKTWMMSVLSRIFQYIGNHFLLVVGLFRQLTNSI